MCLVAGEIVADDTPADWAIAGVRRPDEVRARAEAHQ
jgi:hypothetical protein